MYACRQREIKYRLRYPLVSNHDSATMLRASEHAPYPFLLVFYLKTGVSIH